MTRIHSINKVHLRKTICFEEVCDNTKKSTHFHSNNSLIYTPQFHATYGSIMPGRYFSSGTGYRCGFNTQEKSDEISGNGNHTTALFWEYDTRLGRRWNVDPVVKTHESPYAAIGNNPIWLVDPDGLDTSFADNNSRQEFRSTYKRIDDAIKDLYKKIENKLAKWKEKGYNNQKINKQKSHQIGMLNEKYSQLNEIKNSFDEVINSCVMFFYTARPNPEGIYKAGGGTKYDTKNNRINIWFYSGNSGTVVHETRHGSGYSYGEWGWNSATDEPTNYDYQDEDEAYHQESNYKLVLKLGIGRTKIEIMNTITSDYGNIKYMIKEFHQYCEPKEPCK